LIHPNADIILTLEKPVTGGRMLARHEGQIVLVAGGIPGERVRARVERVSRQMAFAETVDVLEPSPDRRASDVEWACGGSLYAHISYRRQMALKSELVSDAFTRIAKITLPDPVPVMASQEEGYRMRARLHARDGTFGFFREGTHELCDAAATRQLLPATMAALRELEAALRSPRVSVVTSCELSENARADERAVLLELDASQEPPMHLEQVVGIHRGCLWQPRGLAPECWSGSPFVTDQLDVAGNAITLTHHVQSFFQGNRYLVSRLASQVLEHVPDGRVTDLYAGVGLFAVSLAARGGRDRGGRG
jgi:tRNA/tmRNA/rRNA uracil-C5-methylase (TrmA/RlmC/RlmD family)